MQLHNNDIYSIILPYIQQEHIPNIKLDLYLHTSKCGCQKLCSLQLPFYQGRKNMHIRKLSQSGTGAILVPLIRVGEECFWSTWPCILMTNESFHLLLTLPHKTHYQNNIEAVMLHCSNTVNMSPPGLSSYDKKVQCWSAKDSRYTGRKERKKGRESQRWRQS